MEILTQWIQPELLVLVPILYLLGTWMKQSKKFPDEKIPLTLGAVSIVLCTLYVFSSAPAATAREVLHALFASVTQGILCAGASVYVHQCIKQGKAASLSPQDASAAAGASPAATHNTAPKA